MLKTRIIPTLLFNDLKLVKGKKFNSWRTVGEVVQAARLYNIRKVDELILLDISATNNKYKIDLDLVNEVANECFMPLTFGGGINTLEDISNLFRAGADKVSINTAALKDLSFVEKACNLFGGQSIVISIDYRLINDEVVIFSNSGKVSSNINIFQYLKNLEKCGVGDILVTSIDRDGTMKGYDLKTIKKITENTKVPVIASGGAGEFENILALLKSTDLSGISASSIYHFTGVTPIDLNKYLFKNNIPVRL